MLFGIHSKMPKMPWWRSLIGRVTLWYSSFMVLLMLLVIIGGAFISTSFVDADRKQSLRMEVQKMKHDLERGERDLDFFDDGIYYALYDSSGSLKDSALPRSFDASLAYNKEQVRLYAQGEHHYYYYDSQVLNGDFWVRGVILQNNQTRGLTSLLQLLMWSSPIIIIGIIGGGYWILRRGFRPVQVMTDTANDIRMSQDLAKRIELGQSQDELYALGQTLNEMLATVEQSFEREKRFNQDVSHELRTPVAVIMAESEYGMKFSDTLEEAQESCATIHRQAKRLRDMMEQILMLTKLDQSTTIETQPLNVSNWLAARQAEYQKIAPHIHWHIHIAENGWISANELLLGRVLDNLIGNALKFTRDEISVNLAIEQAQLCLSVADNGIGMPAEVLTKIWDRFYQVDSARQKKEHAGSGLGLSLVAQIVQLHHGKVQVESIEGQGSIFKVYLPIIERELSDD